MTPALTPVVTLLIENQALLKTLLTLQVNSLSDQTGESRAELNKKVDDAIEENMRIAWKGFYESFPEARTTPGEF